jgi:hypothetical protein
MSGQTDNPRDANERATHNRLILALEDLEEARSYALYVVTHEIDERLVLEGLQAAMVVAYGRCFSGDGGNVTEALPTVPERFLKALSPDLRAIHKRLLVLRHQEFAHSDSDAAAISMTRWVLPNEVIVGPDHRALRTLLPMDELERVIELVNTVRSGVLQEVARIQHWFKDAGSLPTQQVLGGVHSNER